MVSYTHPPLRQASRANQVIHLISRIALELIQGPSKVCADHCEVGEITGSFTEKQTLFHVPAVKFLVPAFQNQNRTFK